MSFVTKIYHLFEPSSDTLSSVLSTVSHKDIVIVTGNVCKYYTTADDEDLKLISLLNQYPHNNLYIVTNHMPIGYKFLNKRVYNEPAIIKDIQFREHVHLTFHGHQAIGFKTISFLFGHLDGHMDQHNVEDGSFILDIETNKKENILFESGIVRLVAHNDRCNDAAPINSNIKIDEVVVRCSNCTYEYLKQLKVRLRNIYECNSIIFDNTEIILGYLGQLSKYIPDASRHRKILSNILANHPHKAKLIELHKAMYPAHVHAAANYELRYLAWANVYCYGENNHINFNIGKIAICTIIGKNRYGKSAILDILSRILYNISLRGTKTDILNKNKKTGHIQANIHANGHDIWIQQKYTQSRTDCILNVDGQEVLNGASIKDLYIYMQQYVGNFNMFQSTHIAVQNRRFIMDFTNAEYTKLISMISKLDPYLYIEDKVKKEISYQKRFIKETTERLADTSTELSTEEIKSQIASITHDLAIMQETEKKYIQKQMKYCKIFDHKHDKEYKSVRKMMPSDYIPSQSRYDHLQEQMKNKKFYAPSCHACTHNQTISSSTIDEKALGLEYLFLCLHYKANAYNNAVTSQLTKCQEEYARLMVDVESCSKRREDLMYQLNAAQHIDSIKQAQHKLDLYNEYYKCINRAEGIPHHVTKTINKMLEVVTNVILDNVTDFNIEIVNESKILVVEPSVTIPIAMSSGYQKFIVDLVIRIVLLKIYDPDAKYIFIDEGFGCLDASNLLKVINTINALQVFFNGIFLITHIQEIDYHAQTHIKISKLPGPSNDSRVQHGPSVSYEMVVQRDTLDANKLVQIRGSVFNCLACDKEFKYTPAALSRHCMAKTLQSKHKRYLQQSFT
jgi:energy-coupling factor transporter ATP-binding protein EcfA2